MARWCPAKVLMEVRIVTVSGKKDLRTFIHLPAKVHRGHSNWVPPLYSDDYKFFNPAKNKSFKYCDAVLLLAYRGNRPAGRVMGVINHRYNSSHNEDHARFAFLECRKEPEVADALLNAVGEWARTRGMARLVGPMGFSDKDPQGFLIEGFDEPMALATNCNYPYMGGLVERNGFHKKTDLVVYKIDIPDEVPAVYDRVAERVITRNKISVREPATKKQMKTHIRPVLSLVNETFGEIYGFDPMTHEEMDELASRFMSILDQRFLKVIENGKGEHIAFILGMPDISSGIIRSKGYLLPFGIFHILRAAKKSRQLNLLLGAIREDYRNAGLDAVLAVRILAAARKAGMKTIDSHLELEDNLKVRAEMERIGGTVYKRYRIYEKDL
jgi:hypothetical protein